MVVRRGGGIVVAVEVTELEGEGASSTVEVILIVTIVVIHDKSVAIGDGGPGTRDGHVQDGRAGVIYAAGTDRVIRWLGQVAAQTLQT